MIKGIKEEKDEIAKDVADDFIKTKLEIKDGLDIQTAYRFGKGRQRSLYVKLLDPNDMGHIFRHVKNLKEKTNHEDKHFSIDEQLTERDFATKTRHFDIKKENQQLPASHQRDVLKKGKELYVDDVSPDSKTSSGRLES